MQCGRLVRDYLEAEVGAPAEQVQEEGGFEMAKSREHWTVVGDPLSELDLVHVVHRQHF